MRGILTVLHGPMTELEASCTLADVLTSNFNSSTHCQTIFEHNQLYIMLMLVSSATAMSQRNPHGKSGYLRSYSLSIIQDLKRQTHSFYKRYALHQIPPKIADLWCNWLKLSTCEISSPQYSDMNSCFSAFSLT